MSIFSRSQPKENGMSTTETAPAKINVPKTVFTAAKKAYDQAVKKHEEAGAVVAQRKATLDQMQVAD
jgi:hypothetical protein